MDKIVNADFLIEKTPNKTMLEVHKMLAAFSKKTVVNEISNRAVVLARINAGRWIADCECNGAEYVHPEQNTFFCSSCGNLQDGGKLRLVEFPKDYKKIEVELLKRKILPKELLVSETLDDVIKQNKFEIEVK